jgi:hypothetical protein
VLLIVNVKAILPILLEPLPRSLLIIDDQRSNVKSLVTYSVTSADVILPALLLDMHEFLVLGFMQFLANLLDLQLTLMFL